jgi:hypothetical protein
MSAVSSANPLFTVRSADLPAIRRILSESITCRTLQGPLTGFSALIVLKLLFMIVYPEIKKSLPEIRKRYVSLFPPSSFRFQNKSVGFSTIYLMQSDYQLRTALSIQLSSRRDKVAGLHRAYSLRRS